MQAGLSFLRLLAGTVLHRPYVYAFFACYLCFSLPQFRTRDALIHIAVVYLIAFAAEYSSTRNGFPFGMYVYLDQSRAEELWVSNVPFWDSLSFVSLSYFSWITAASVLSPADPSRALPRPASAVLGGALMMLLDVVIDPLTLLGDRWFLGKVYYYPGGGTYFGVTLRNFAGWFFVGALAIGVFQALSRIGVLRPSRWRRLSPLQSRAAVGVYASVFLFNLAITAWIGEWRLLGAGVALVAATLLPCLARIFSPLQAAEPLR